MGVASADNNVKTLPADHVVRTCNSDVSVAPVHLVGASLSVSAHNCCGLRDQRSVKDGSVAFPAGLVFGGFGRGQGQSGVGASVSLLIKNHFHGRIHHVLGLVGLPVEHSRVLNSVAFVLPLGLENNFRIVAVFEGDVGHIAELAVGGCALQQGDHGHIDVLRSFCQVLAAHEEALCVGFAVAAQICEGRVLVEVDRRFPADVAGEGSGPGAHSDH